MDIENFFNFRNVAVIGASRDPEKVGHSVFKNLLQNKFLKVFPVNPNASEILGRKCYGGLVEIPYFIDFFNKPKIMLERLPETCRKNVSDVWEEFFRLRQSDDPLGFLSDVIVSLKIKSADVLKENQVHLFLKALEKTQNFLQDQNNVAE